MKGNCASSGSRKTIHVQYNVDGSKFGYIPFLERGNHHIQAFISFIQHKTPEIVCNPHATFFLVDFAIGITFIIPFSKGGLIMCVGKLE